MHKFIRLISRGAVGVALLLSFSAQAANTTLVNTSMDSAALNPTENTGTVNPLVNGTVNTPASVNAPISVPLSVSCTVGNGTAINNALAAAQTPQQAARLFAKLISPALGQAVANAVQQVLAQTESQSTNANPPTATPPIQGWQDLVAENGLSMTLSWPSPGLATAGNLPVTILQSGTALRVTVVQAGGTTAVGTAAFRVSVNGTF